MTTFAGLRSQLRGLFAAVLVLCVLVAGFPGAAFAVDYADPEYAIGVSNYGYTDEGMTVSMLAEDLGASPRATLALACWVDSWVVGSDYQQLTASQMANVASGVQAYMVQHDTWDSFTETVEGLTAIGSSVYLNVGALWDALGVASLAEPASVSNQGNYVSGFLVGQDVVVPQYSGSKTATEVAFGYGVLQDPGYHFKAVSASLLVSGPAFWRLMTPGGAFRCMTCGNALGSLGSGSSESFMVWGGTSWYSFAVPSTEEIDLHADCTPASESATVIQALINTNSLPTTLALANAIYSNPGATALGALDAYGIPSYLPPGVVQDMLEGTASWGDDLAALADSMGETVADLTGEGASLLEQGTGAILATLSGLIDWVGSFWDRLQAVTISLLVPDEGWVRTEFASNLEDLRDRLMLIFPFSYFQVAWDLQEYIEGASQ